MFFSNRRTKLDFLTDYWTFSNSMIKVHLTGRQEMFYMLWLIYITEIGFRVGSRKIICDQLI